MKNPTVLASLIIFMAGMWVLGIVAKRLIKTVGDYFVAGRRLGPWVTALTHEATSHSAYVYMAVPGNAFNTGLQNIWITIPAIIKPYINFIGLGRRLRTLSEKLDCYTYPDLLESRFEDHTRSLRILSVIITIFFMEVYAAAQFVGAGQLLETITGANYALMTIIMGATVVGYSVLGGFFAIAWTDFVQGLIMAVGFVIISFYGFLETGSLGELAARLKEADPKLVSAHAPLLTIVGFLFLTAGFFGAPHIIIRFFAMKSGFKVVRVAAIVSLLWATLIFYCGTYAGMVGRAVMPDIQRPDMVVMEFALLKLPAVLAGIVASAIISAIMSSVDSQLLTAATSAVRDVYQKLIRPDVSDEKVLFLSRIAVIVMGAVAVAIAIRPSRSLFVFILYAWAGLGTMAPLTLAACYWKGATRVGAFWSLLVSSLVVILWNGFGLSKITYEMFPSFVIGTAVLILVSLLTRKKRPSQRIMEMMDEFSQKGASLEDDRGETITRRGITEMEVLKGYIIRWGYL